MLKPAGASCNLRCQYCYYLEKASLYPQSPMVMSDELLQTFIRQYIEAQTMPQVLFTWHGGEPLLRPLSFYRRALQLQKLYSRGRQIDNCLQTNGLLLTDEWCEFLAENQFLVGISIDGPENIHDHYRRDVAGQGTFARVMKAIRLLQKHGVEWNAMAVVTNNSMYHPQEFYRFFKDIGCQYLQFTPIVERERHRPWQLTDASVTTEGWGHFLCGVYDEWVRHDVGRIFVQLFDAVLSNWVGQQPGICSLSAMCGHVAAMEWNGDVYSCDHFVFPEYKLGNINTHSLTEMMYGQQQRHFSSMKTTLPRQCHECRYLTTCYGECPKNRFITDRYDNPGLNYLCNGYRQFFNHVASDMDFMAAELRAGRAPSNILLR